MAGAGIILGRNSPDCVGVNSFVISDADIHIGEDFGDVAPAGKASRRDESEAQVFVEPDSEEEKRLGIVACLSRVEGSDVQVGVVGVGKIQQ